MKDVQASWVKAEASRCLLCLDAPCSNACPAGVDVRGFIRALKFGDPDRSLNIIMESNILAGTCGILCRHELLCEGACTSNALEDPIQIGRLQHYAAAVGRPDMSAYQREAKDGPVAIIGAGPAGFAAAAELLKLGVRPVVFEASDRVGGVLNDTLPKFRQPYELVQKEFNRFKDLIEVRYNQALGRDFTVKDLMDQGFKAVFVGLGRLGSKSLGVDGEDLENVMNALKFLRQAFEGNLDIRGKHVVVIGGGGVAVDCVLSALENDAKATLLYRRSPDLMPATTGEKAEIVIKGASVIGNRLPIAFEQRDERVVVHAAEVIWEDDGSKKPKKWHLNTDNTWDIEADMVVVAIGEEVDPAIKKGLEGVKFDRDNAIVVNEDFMTDVPGVFAGGDCTNISQGTIVAAVAQGRDAARAIAQYIKEGR